MARSAARYCRRFRRSAWEQTLNQNIAKPTIRRYHLWFSTTDACRLPQSRRAPGQSCQRVISRPRTSRPSSPRTSRPSPRSQT
eukprot:1924928-Rhodomonas_salina.1